MLYLFAAVTEAGLIATGYAIFHGHWRAASYCVMLIVINICLGGLWSTSY